MISIYCLLNQNPYQLLAFLCWKDALPKLKESHEENGLIDIQMLGIVVQYTSNLITGRYYRKKSCSGSMILGATKILKTQIPADVNVSAAVDSLHRLNSNPQSAGAKSIHSVSPRVFTKAKRLLWIQASNKARIGKARLSKPIDFFKFCRRYSGGT